MFTVIVLSPFTLIEVEREDFARALAIRLSEKRGGKPWVVYSPMETVVDASHQWMIDPASEYISN